MSSRTAGLVLGGVTGLFAACGGQGGDAESREAPVWQLADTPSISIGESSGPSELLFQRIVSARLLEDGRIAVADGGTSTLRVFGADGGLQAEIGGPGEGPAEFRSLTELVVVSPDTLLVFDADAIELTRFLPDGTLLSAQSMIPAGASPGFWVGAYPNGEFAFGWLTGLFPIDGAVTVDSVQFGRFASDGRFVSETGRASGMRRLRSPVPFSPLINAVVVGDSIFYTDGLEPRITILGPRGDRARAIEIATTSVTPSEAWAGLKAAQEAGDDGPEITYVEPPSETDRIPHLAHLLADDQDRLWVKRYDPTTDNTVLGHRAGGFWWVLRTDGAPVATVELPTGFVLHDVRGDRLLGVTRDELDVERLAVYDIIP